MPWLAAAVVGSALVGAVAGSHASNQAAKASQEATDASTAVNNRALDLQQSNTATQRQVGDAALNSLAGRFGLSTPSAQQSNQPSTAQGGQAQNGPNWDAYLSANPDVAQAFQTQQAQLAQQGITTPQQFAQQHYQQYGQTEGRALPTYEPPPADQGAASQGASNVDSTGSYTVDRPTVGPAPTFTAPTLGTAPAYSTSAYRETQIDPLKVGIDSYVQSPDFQFQLDQGNKNILTAGAATGTLQSGSALKALQKYGQDLAMGDYSQWRNYQTDQYNTNRANVQSQDAAANSFNTTQANNKYNADTGAFQFGANYNATNALNNYQTANNAYQYGTNLANQNYTSDRDYATGQYNAGTNALLSLAGQGANATGALNNAIGTNASSVSNGLMTNASTQGNASLANAGLIANAAGNSANALAYYYGNQGKAA